MIENIFSFNKMYIYNDDLKICILVDNSHIYRKEYIKVKLIIYWVGKSTV